MCGIVGLLTTGKVDENVIRRMIRPLAHRGPDDEGVWTDPEAGIGFGHRRLSIVDLSPLGHQPMVSADGRWVLSYNGETYNHAALRNELDAAKSGIAWRGHSDTETLVECIAAWGLEATLARTIGMFALSLWDRREQRLHLARDRFGEKPLYYGWAGGAFVFASELKAIRQRAGFDNPVSRTALALYAARNYVPAPFSIYEGLYKLEPGCILTLPRASAAAPRSEPPEEGRSDGGVALRRYWSYRDVVRRGLADPVKDEEEALERLERALAEAIKGQAVADVPVGAFLSGGIDSSTVVALYQKYSPIPVRTFSIGFEEAGYDEARYAEAVARHLGTVHNERYVTVKETQDVIPLLPAMYDEPFADSSQIPTHLVSRFAREQVTVALSGDGGDELFAGYNRHFAAPRLWQRLQMLPRPVRGLVGPALSQLPPALWNAAPGRRAPNFGAKVQKALRVAASARSFNDVYCSFLDEWSFEPSPVLDAGAKTAGFDLDVAPSAPDAVRMMYCDAVSYLPDDILCKVDRAAMAVSLETRVPFLDHRVAEVAAHIPLGMKVRGGIGKYILRELLYREAPRALFERPKAGFAIPVGEWLRGPLRDWAEDLLDPRLMAEEGWFDPAVIRRRWDTHLSGRRDSTPALWAVLMFQAWLRADAPAAHQELRDCA
ncbi:MAG TPA: asparagine synthase (glutamine-hydrolyzing) [Allosphingosinicella sp.]|nr:asparagine synthase (glutamine-hydrolyzing) [Allosphingosinicella sp.]